MNWLTTGSAAINAAGRAALGTGANLLRQEKWNWQSVMASAAGAAAGTLVGQALGNSEWGQVLRPQGVQTAAGFAGGVVSGWAGRGGKTDYLSVFASAAASSYGGGPGQQRGGRSDQELDLNGGPAPGAGAQEFYEQFVQQATAREDGPEPSLAGATQYAQARLLSVVEGSGRDRLNIGPLDERTDAVVRAAMARSQARDRAAQADINAQLQQLKASIDKSQALANMQAMADAYRASGMVGATGDPQPYLFTVQSATLAAAASQPLTPSTQAVGVAAESGLRAAAEIPLAVVDLAQAGVGAAITATTGYVPDLTMYSGMGRSAQEGAGTGEMLQNMNPMLGLFIGTDQALYGLLQGDTRPLASLSGSLLGGGLAGRVTPSMPGYRPGMWSPGTVRAGQFAADAMPRLSPSGPMGLRAQMGAAGDLSSALPTVATVGGTGAVDGAGLGFRLNEAGPTRLVARDPVDLAAQRRLNALDGDVGKFRPGEAGVAAEMENYLGGTLTRAPAGTSADFIFESGNFAGARMDLKLTPDTFAKADKLNTYFDKTFPKFSESFADKLAKPNGVDLMPFDTRFLTPANTQKLFDFVDTLPLSSQRKILYLGHH